MLRISDLSVPVEKGEAVLPALICKTLGIPREALLSYKIFRRSLDARRGHSFLYHYTIDVAVSDEAALLRRAGLSGVRIAPEQGYILPAGRKDCGERPVVVGFGPAGIFCALLLAEAGLRPVILERGRRVEDRVSDVERFWTDARLCPESNVQFGEGGAGTFSDGKLNTLVKDKNYRGRYVLEQFVEAGAPAEILYHNKPHIGTDRLRRVIPYLREKILSLGGSIHFETRLTDFRTEDGRLRGAEAEGPDGSVFLPADALFLGIGHSARDTFSMLKERGIAMERKPFSVGLRIEHLQKEIDRVQYRSYVGLPGLGAADYKLAFTGRDGRGVYTFCMCPGGTVVAAASEENTVVTNGMSDFARDGENANSAVLVSVLPSDFEGGDVLAGVAFQRRLERDAFLLGGANYAAPIQTVGDFLSDRRSQALGNVRPSYTGAVTLTNLREILPAYIADALADGIPALGRKLQGFDDPNAVLTGCETRSSSPVRILRQADSLQSISCKGLYPIGEGAGYAGGIMSAAMDGMRAAERFIRGDASASAEAACLPD